MGNNTVLLPAEDQMKQLIQDTDLPEFVDGLLRQGLRYRAIAKQAGLKEQTLHTKLRAMGYKTARRLEPIHAVEIEAA